MQPPTLRTDHESGGDTSRDDAPGTVLPSTLDAIRLGADARDLQRALSELTRVIQFRDRDRICRYDVTVSQCYALQALTESGPLSVNELAAQLYLDKSTASRLAQGLEEKGYLRKITDPGDRRGLRLDVTDAGRRISRRIDHDLTQEHATLLSEFDEEVRERTVELVTRLARAAAARVDASCGSCCVVE